MLEDATPFSCLGPMVEVGVDMFHVGRAVYLVVVDRYSSMPMHRKGKAETTAEAIRACEDFFNWWGLPEVLRSDDGPCFQSQFREWCRSKGIKHELSSSYNSASNGLAESGVKKCAGVGWLGDG